MTPNEIDEAVAVEIFGYARKENMHGEIYFTLGPSVPAIYLWQLKFSTDIAAAWRVVEKMRTIGWWLKFHDVIEIPEWCALFDTIPPVGKKMEDYTFSAMHENPATAICLAALAAVRSKQ